MPKVQCLLAYTATCHMTPRRSRVCLSLALCFVFLQLSVIAAAAAATTTATTVSTTQPAAATANMSAIATKASTFDSLLLIRSRSSSNAGNAGGFAALDKEVVERLIKQWAPVVWLAPEEKFLPLGVEEFLNHVHPMGDKGKTFIPGMPIGDNSKKAFLVTNAEVDELLDNEKSFIYGRNPNDAPVPIYAVVTLCNEPPPPNRPIGPQLNEGTQISQQRQQQKQQLEQLQQQQQLQQLQQQQQQHQPLSMPSIRGSYIPVSIDPLDDHNDTVRRSSRLYPVFKRAKRDISVFAPIYEQHSYVPPAGKPLNMAPPSMPINAAGYELVMGETETSIGANSGDADASAQYTTTVDPTEENGGGHVNNFIANLVDNVKFSVDDELDNSINFDGNLNELFDDVGGIQAEQGDVQNGQKMPAFHVTFWMFYPYSQGKTMCTVSLGPLGSIPFPAVYGFCLGRRKDIGSHIGDWEHMSLFFNGAAEPEAMYVSAHDAGAYYTYNRLTGSFEFKKQETRKGILQRPNFPKTVTTFNNHPVLFAAKGSHGLWTAPGKHRFVKVARLYDINGFGTPWNTWKAVDITYENLKSYGRALIPTWLSFKGKWGNPKSKCHPFRRIGLNFCEYTDGPTGIPLKEPHFQCGATYR